MGANVVNLFWCAIHTADFDRLNELMSEEANVYLPNTKEVFKGKSKYIDFNKKYPDRWLVELEKQYACDDVVITSAKIYNAEETVSFYCTSFFKITNNVIVEITEYWGENGPPPKWRIEENLSETYE